MDNNGFKDVRNAAELLLSPGQPLSRSVANLGSLKMNIGGTAIPGAISGASQLTGAIRQAFSGIIQAKEMVAQLSGSMSQTLSQFNPENVSANPLSPIANVDINGLPVAGLFTSFSSLPPGQPLTQSFKQMLAERKQALQLFTAHIASGLTGIGTIGVMLQENLKKTPYPLEIEIDAPSFPRLAQGGGAAQQDPILKDKNRFVVAGVTIGSGKPSFWSRLLGELAAKAAPTFNPVVGQVFKDRKNQSTWSEPPSPYAAQYPFNKVQQTESGHVIELDDTPGAERVHVFHRSGSFIEFHPNGTVVCKNMKDGYTLTMANQHVKVAGKCHVAVDGDATLYVKGDAHIQSDSDVNVRAKKDFNVYATNINLRAQRKFKADGIQMDLRYINLPTNIGVAMGAGIVPRVNLLALASDFPKGNWAAIEASGGKLDPRVVSSQISAAMATANTALPVENPLANPAVYVATGAAAIAYRARLFDTPEEVGDLEKYTSHIDLQNTLKDTDGDPRQLGGKLVDGGIAPRTVDRGAPVYLNYDDYRGTFEWANNYALANTSFRIENVVDTLLYPDIIQVVGTTATGGEQAPAGEPTAPNMMWVLEEVLHSQTWRLAKEFEDEPDGRGAFTEAAVTRLHAIDANWGHIRKHGGQNQYNGHAVDAIIYKRPDGSAAEVYDVVTGGGHIAWAFKGASAADIEKWYI